MSTLDFNGQLEATGVSLETFKGHVDCSLEEYMK